jgi:hypothetical protein
MVLELVPDEVCVVLVGLLEKPFDVVHRRPCFTLVIVCGGHGAPHAAIACLIIVVISHGRGPLKALFASPLLPLTPFLGVVGGNVEWSLQVTARGCLPASLGRVKNDHLVAGGAWGGDAARLLERVPEEVTMVAPLWALCAVLKRCACATIASLVVSLGLTALTLLP